MDSLFLATIRKLLLTFRLLDCCVLSVKKYRLGTSNCHDHNILTLHQPIRLQHFERGNEINKTFSTASFDSSNLPELYTGFKIKHIPIPTNHNDTLHASTYIMKNFRYFKACIPPLLA